MIGRFSLVLYLDLPDHIEGGVLCQVLLQPVHIDKLVKVLHPLIEMQVNWHILTLALQLHMMWTKRHLNSSYVL